VVAAPVFKEIMSQALPLLDVPPTDKVVEPKWPTPDKVSPGAPGVLTDYSSANFVIGKIPKNDKSSRAPIPMPKSSEQAYLMSSLSNPKNLKPFLGTEGADPESKNTAITNPFVMPDLRGLTTREVMNVLSQHKLSVEYFGSGIAYSQEPRAGAHISPGDIVRISFQARK
jgi:hypothetical protein